MCIQIYSVGSVGFLLKAYGFLKQALVSPKAPEYS
jgi:hypothetical protein